MKQQDLILTNEEIVVVNNLLCAKPVREIAAKVGRSLMALHHYIRHRDNYPPSSSTKTVGCACHSTTKAKNASPTNVVSTTTTTTTRSTPVKKPKAEPMLQTYQVKERHDFAMTYVSWSLDHWRQVVFHDERKINLDGPDGFTYYYHDLQNEERLLSKRPRGGSVFVWFAICYDGRIRCEVSTTKWKPDTLLQYLQTDRAVISQRIGTYNFILQDTCHNFHNITSQGNLDMKGIEPQQWPQVRHDLNIVENVWGWLIRDIFNNGQRYYRRTDLKVAVENAWTKLPTHFIQNLYSTLPERITELVFTKGRYTNCC